MATTGKRQGVRQEDVTAMARAFAVAASEGAGPDEAFMRARAIREVSDVEPEILLNWRDDVEKMAKENMIFGPTAASKSDGAAAELEIARLKKQLSALAAEREEIEKANTDLQKAHAELETKHTQLTKEHEELVLGKEQ